MGQGSGKSSLFSWHVVTDSWVSLVSIHFQPCLFFMMQRPMPAKFKATVAAGSLKSFRFVADSSRSCTEISGSFHGGRKQIQWLQLVGTRRHCASLCLGVGDPKCVQMRPCRIGMNVECCTGCQTDQGLTIKGSMKENPDISCCVRCILDHCRWFN